MIWCQMFNGKQLKNRGMRIFTFLLECCVQERETQKADTFTRMRYEDKNNKFSFSLNYRSQILTFIS